MRRLLPNLAARPWHEVAAHRLAIALEARAGAIRAEFLALRAAALPLGKVGGRAAHDHTLVAAGEWREAPLFGNGRKHAELCARCPVTTATLEACDEAVGMALSGGGESLFSVLAPGTHLRPHCGSTNARLTCHLGVLVPPGCSVRVGDETRGWEEGKCIVFDDSFEHEVWHRGQSERAVLLVNFWHPDLLREMRRIEVDQYGYEPI